MWRVWCIVIASMLSSTAQGETQWLLHPSNVVSVYDGDTIYVNIPGLPPVFGEDLGIRLRGVDTPELRSRCNSADERERERTLGYLIRDLVNNRVMSGEEILITDISRGSFFRVVATVIVDGVSINQWLLDNGYAYEVIDEKMRPGYWCDSSNF